MKKPLLLLLLSFSLIGSAYATSHFHNWPDDSICMWVKQKPNNEGYLNEARKRGLVCNGIVYGTPPEENPSQEPENDSKSNGLPICTGWFKSNWNNCVGETTLPNGTVYVGEFKNGLRHGQGTSTKPDGTVFVGKFKNDQPFKGKLTSPDGYGLDAEYSKKGQAAKGIVTHTNGTNFNFECKVNSENTHTHLAEPTCSGKGTIVMDGKGTYVGEIQNNKRHGQGKFIYQGSKIEKEGIWKNDVFIKKNVVPENARATGDSWKCNSGYVKYDMVCITLPTNAFKTFKDGWKCNSGYIKSGQSCAKIPKNASASGESSWTCNSPFKQSGNFCITIPLNASASGNGGWECDSGSKKIGDICKIQQVKNLHFHSGTKSIDELDFSSTNFCDLSPKVQLRNHNFYLPNQDNPYSGENLCVYLINGQNYSRGDIKKGLRQDNWTYWHQNGQKMAEGLYLDGVPEGQWSFWDENGSQESSDIRISISELKINTAKIGNDVASTDKIDYQSEKHLGKLAYCAGMMSTINPDMGEAGKQIYIIVFEELFPDSDIKNIVKKGFDLGKREYAALEFAADFDQVMSNAEERARVSENCSRLSAQFLESMEGVGGYRP